MSILIKGRDLPKNCDECVAEFGGRCYLAPPESDWFCPAEPQMGRADFCPLVHVPEHGRLIDADELANHKFIAIDGPDEGATYRLGWNTAIEAIMEYAPTIIPAEEAET